MSYKEDRDWTIFAHAGLNAICNPSWTVSFEVRSSAMQKKKTKQNKTKQKTKKKEKQQTNKQKQQQQQ